ncbi:MAG: Holliday junction branch migration protein RuvA [Candidatus Pacebacteria bacterium]|nr:Holliday junction branch migration protein RuvA [Candidatus Paceibacterota bacterium]MBP9716128.1 Holliday junction branch migration protein RuvA [Candidatus Paceibacterota bacterium]
MIAHLTGTILYTTDKYTIIDVNGVGYKVFLSTTNIASCDTGSEKKFWIYTAVRETALDLYGFESINEMNFFELLLDVSGIGPKGALGILSIASIDSLQRAIATGDTGYLTKVSGIGRKTAEKIVIELRDKLKAHAGVDGTSGGLREESDMIEALKSLGYSQNEARDALKQIPSSVTDMNGKIKEALKILSGK